MRIDDATLVAYLDGELEDEGQYELIESELAENPALRLRLHALVDSGERIRRAFDAKLEEAVPPRLIEAVLNAAMPGAAAAQAATHAPVGQTRPRATSGWLDRLSGWFGPVVAFASVAALALGVVIGQGMVQPHEGGGSADVAPLAARVGDPVRDAALAVALEAAPSGRVLAAGEARVEIVASFEDADGRFCREFGVSTEGPAARDELGVACREGEGVWRLAFHAATPAAAADDYRTASDSLHEAADEFLASRARDGMLDAERERALLDSGWQR